jgi:hypothetical protein
MKVKMLKPQSNVLTIITLIALVSISYCLQISRGSNILSPNTKIDDKNQDRNNDSFLKKNLINDTKNDEISNFNYFKTFLFNILNSKKIYGLINPIEKISSDDDIYSDFESKTRLNFGKDKTLNFNNDSVGIAEVSKCDFDSCDTGNGRCLTNTKCQCNYSFINAPNLSNKACDYKLTFQLTALLLEMLFPIGFGHFYCKRYLIGFIKFVILFIIPMIIFAIMKLYFYNNDDLRRKKFGGKNKIIEKFLSLDSIMKRLISFYYLIIFISWYLFDLVIFAANKHKDGSGFDLIPIYNN